MLVTNHYFFQNLGCWMRMPDHEKLQHQESESLENAGSSSRFSSHLTSSLYYTTSFVSTFSSLLLFSFPHSSFSSLSSDYQRHLEVTSLMLLTTFLLSVTMNILGFVLCSSLSIVMSLKLFFLLLLFRIGGSLFE